MAKKSTRSTSSVNGFWDSHKEYIVPSLIGGVIAFIFSEDLQLGIVVFITVWISSWVGRTMLRKK